MRRLNGFTLIEIMLYSVIFTTILGGMMLYAFSILTSTQRNATRIEVIDNSRFMTQKVQQVIHGAVDINTPAAGGTMSTSLSLQTATASWNPFVIDVANGTLRFKRGSSTAIPITNDFVTISSISFRNYVYSPNTNTIQFKAKVTSVDPARPVSTSFEIYIPLQ